MLFGKHVLNVFYTSVSAGSWGWIFLFFFKWVRVPTFVAHGLVLGTNIGGWEDAVKSWEHTGGARTTRALLEIRCFWAECRGWVALARRAFIQAFASIPFSFPSFFHFSFGCFQFPRPPAVAQHVFSSHPVSLQLFLFFRTFPHGELCTQPPSRKQQRTQCKWAPWQKDRFPPW